MITAERISSSLYSRGFQPDFTSIGIQEVSDIEEYLNWLEEFELQSRQVNLMIG